MTNFISQKTSGSSTLNYDFEIARRLTVMTGGTTVSSSIASALEAVPCLGAFATMFTVIGHAPVRTRCKDRRKLNERQDLHAAKFRAAQAVYHVLA